MMQAEFRAVPLQGYGDEEIDPEEQKIQKMRERKIRESMERSANRKIDERMKGNKNKLKDYVNRKYKG